MNENYSFETLEAWKAAREFRKEIKLLAAKFPNHEQYKLTDQIIRSSRSVSANIAEGRGRFHYLDNTRFCRIARGSLTETLDHLICANDEGYISAEELQNMREKYNRCLKVLNGYIAYLKKQKAS